MGVVDAVGWACVLRGHHIQNEAQTLQRWSRICWKQTMSWEACDKQNTWECWTCAAAINKDQWPTVWEPEAPQGILKTTVSEILMQDLGMKCAVATFVPWLLLPEHKEHRAAVRRTVWGLKVSTLKGIEASLSYVQGFLYFLSSLINVSSFHSTWLDTFWTDLVSPRCVVKKFHIFSFPFIVYVINSCETLLCRGFLFWGKDESPLTYWSKNDMYWETLG